MTNIIEPTTPVAPAADVVTDELATPAAVLRFAHVDDGLAARMAVLNEKSLGT